MDQAIRESTLSLLRELNHHERTQEEAREAKRIDALQLETDRRERYKQDVRETISSLS
jgi:hypothetical protein